MTIGTSKTSVVREIGRNKRIIGGSTGTPSSYGGGGGSSGASTSIFLPSLDQTITGAWTFDDILTIKEGADKGLRFPSDAFGGTGDSATMTLEAATGEDLQWKFSLLNDNNDKFYFSAPSDNGMLFNNNVIYHAGNSNAASVSWTANDLNVYGDLILRGEVINPTGEIILVDNAWVMLNNGNSEVDSGLRIDIDGAGTAFSSLYRKASDDSWYIDSAKIALNSGTLQTNLNADLLGGYHATAFPRKLENAQVLGSWTFRNGALFYGTSINNRALIDINGNISNFSNGVMQNELPISGDSYLNRTSGNLRVGGSVAPTEKLDVTGNIKSNAKVISGEGTTGGFFNSTYASGRNNVWAFNTSVNYGIAYNEDGGNDEIRFMFGDYGSPSFSFGAEGNLTFKGNLRRLAHNTGHLEGSYNNIGDNRSYSNPIYTIGSSFNPSIAALDNMYGIGYSNANSASFLSWVGGTKGWGQYVATDGDARIFLDAQYGHITNTGNLQGSGTFVSGFAGSNWQLNPNDAGDSHLTVDRLTVRGRMDVYELVINQIRATNGSLWVSDAMKYEKDWGSDATYYRIGIDDTDDDNGRMPFAVGDIIKSQRFTGSNVAVTTLLIDSLDASGRYFIALTSERTGNAPEIGDEFVRIGNVSDTSRQGALYLTSSDNGSPYMDIIDGVNTASLSGKSRIRLGKLTGVGGNTGYGIWGSSNGTDENFVISSSGYAKIAGWDFNKESIYKDFQANGYTVFMGVDPILGTATTVRGFGITKDSNNRLIMGQTDSHGFTFTAIVGGSIPFSLNSSNTSQIAGWEFTDTTFSKVLSGSTVWMGTDPNNATFQGFGAYKSDNDYVRMMTVNGHVYLQGSIEGNRIFDLRSDASPSQIAGWEFTSTTLSKVISGSTVWMGVDPNNAAYQGFGCYKSDNDYIRMINSGGNSYLQGRVGGSTIFNLNTAGVSSIAGWNFNQSKFYNNNIELRTGDNDSSLDFKYNSVSAATTGVRWFSDSAGTNEVSSIRYNGVTGRAAGINIKSEYVRFQGKNYGTSGNLSLAQMDGMGLRISGSSASTQGSGGRIMSFSAAGHSMGTASIAAYSILVNSAVAISANTILPSAATLLSVSQNLWDGAFSSESDFNGLTIKITNISTSTRTLTADTGCQIRLTLYDPLFEGYEPTTTDTIGIKGYDTHNLIFFAGYWYLERAEL